MFLDLLFQTPFSIVVAFFYFGLFLLFKWLRSLFVNESATKTRILNGMIFAEYALLTLLVLLHITRPYCREYKGSFGPGDGSYTVAINTWIRWVQTLCFVLICLSLFKHERVYFKKNYLKYILITIISCVIFVSASYLRDLFLRPYHGLFPMKRYFEISGFTAAFFIELLMLVFITSLALSKREKNVPFKFNIHSVLIPALYFIISTYINWQFHNFEPGEWFKYLNEVGGNE